MKRESNYHLLILFVITAVGVFLRLYKIGHIPFTHDELSVVARLRFDTFADLINEGVRVEGHPAGVQLFIWLWAKCFGISELTLRIPFLLMGIACIPLMYSITKLWINRTAGLFTSAIVATSQYYIFNSIVIRPYIAGLFFILLLLFPWTKMVFHKEFRWRNVIFFGIFAASSAYIHQFSMLTAFLIALTGLFLTNKNNIIKYLSGCILAVVLYLPHLSILFHQISLKGVGNWLGPPTPSFIAQYGQYLLHFSFISASGVFAAVICSSRFKKERWEMIKSRLIISLLLFLLPCIIGYIYSVFVNPVLQYPVLIFSSPFLLFLLCAFIRDHLTTQSALAIFVLMATMIYGLLFVRNHYDVMEKEWFDISHKKTIDLYVEKGKENVACMINIDSSFTIYYNSKYGNDILNKIPHRGRCDEQCLDEKLRTSEENYMVTSGFGDCELAIIQHYYPYLIEYIPCISSEVYVFSKTPTDSQVEEMPLIHYEEFIFSAEDAEKEMIQIKEFSLNEITTSRFTRVLLTFEFETDSLNPEYAIVLETSRNDKIVDWRGKNTTGFRLDNNGHSQLFLPFRYELLIKQSKELSHYYSRIYLWNIERSTSIKPIKCTLSIYEGNPYIFSLVERLY